MKSYDFPEINLYGLTLCESDRLCDLMCEKDRIEGEIEFLSEKINEVSEILYSNRLLLSSKKDLNREVNHKETELSELTIDMEKITKEIDRFFLMMQREGKHKGGHQWQK